ncbi:MAG: PAS domain-containing protein, partial [Gammaproteobacteria bacterium]
LIYLDTEVQEKVFELFHFALKPSGHLFLGSSESLGETRRLFGEVDHKAKIFQKRRVANAELHFPLLPNTGVPAPGPRSEAGEAPPAASLQELARAQLLAHYAPPFVIVDENHDMTYISGRVGKYLEPSTGAPSRNILDMAREGLRIELRTALYRALHGGEATNARRVRVQTNGEAERVGLTVQPLTEAEGHVLVVFEALEAGEAPEPADDDERDVVIQLERELKDSQESLQTTIEELETSNEELRASNEELQSVNEELQSTTEELETGKEELQSSNEELLAVNQELQGKNDELARANNDLKNFIASTDIGVLFLDEELRIRRYTPSLAELFNLIASDIGRPLAHITHNLENGDLVTDAERVLRELTVVEKELGSKNGRFYQTRMRPYRTTDSKIGGVVLTFVDVTERHRDEEETRTLNLRLEAQKAYAESIVATVREPLLVLDGDLRVVSAGRAFYRAFKTTPQETEGKLLYELGDGRWDIPELRSLLEESSPQNTEFEDFKACLDLPALGRRDLLLNAWRLQQRKGLEPLMLLAIEDVTERLRAEEHRKLLVHELDHRVKNTLATVQSIAVQTFAGAPAYSELAWRFESRLMALAKTHRLLTRSRWRRVSVHELLAQELAPFSDGENDRLLITGDDVDLHTNTAFALGMAFHELATNAVKFGALSNPEGRIHVVTELVHGEPPRFKLAWTETGGPKVEKPERRGFGSRLISGGLAYELGGKVSTDYRPEGLVCTMDIPLTEKPWGVEEHAEAN